MEIVIIRVWDAGPEMALGADTASHRLELASRFQIPDCSHIFEMIYSGLETDSTHETFAMNGAGLDNKYRPGTAIHTS